MFLTSLSINVILLLLLVISMRGGVKMVDMYVALIIAGRRVITDVNIKYRAAVLADLNALGLDGYGNPIVDND